MIKYTSRGDRGVDYSYGRPTIGSLVQSGYTFVVRYIGGSTIKRLTVSERDTLHNAGIGIVLVWEVSATRPLTGSQGGTQDGVEARIQADALGYPRDMPIIIANDTDVYVGNVGAVKAYNWAFNASAGPCGVYGDTDAFKASAGFSKINWHANAWKNKSVMESHLGPENGPDGYVIHAFQQAQTGVVDPNICNIPFPIWVKDQKVEVIMSGTATILRFSAFHNVFLVGAGTALHLDSALEHSFVARGVPEVISSSHPQLMASLNNQCGPFEWVAR